MAVDNFIPEIWSANLLSYLENTHVFPGLCNRDYEGEISAYGDTVKINQIGPITIGNYSPGETSITPEELTGAQTILNIDQAKYFAFKIEDIDNAQTKPKLMNGAMQRAAYELADDVDEDIAGLYAQAGTSITNQGSSAVTSANVFGLISYVAQKLDEKNVPQSGRWIAVPPWFYRSMVLAEIIFNDTGTNAPIRSGRVGTCFGFDVYVSNNLYQTGTAPAYTTKVLAGTSRAISFASQVVETEAFRPEASFSDAVKGLYVFGRKVVDPDCLVCITAVYTTEISI